MVLLLLLHPEGEPKTGWRDDLERRNFEASSANGGREGWQKGQGEPWRAWASQLPP